MLFLTLILIVLTAWILLPLRGPAGPPIENPAQAAEELEARRRQLVLSLQDLELEFQTGKLSPEDHQAMRRRVQAEAIEVLRQLEALGSHRPTDARPAAP